jgi:hypothetical protein
LRRRSGFRGYKIYRAEWVVRGLPCEEA